MTDTTAAFRPQRGFQNTLLEKLQSQRVLTYEAFKSGDPSLVRLEPIGCGRIETEIVGPAFLTGADRVTADCRA